MFDKILEVAKEAGKKISENIPEFSKEKTESENIPKFLQDMQQGFVKKHINLESEKKKIDKESNYSENINEYITTQEELKVYQDENLKEAKTNDRTILKDSTINLDLKDSEGRTNLQRMEMGLAPKDENGDSYTLHHIGQKSDSPLAELKNKVHTKNDAALHDKTNPTEVHDKDSGVNWDKERAEHWKARAVEIKNGE